MQGCIGVQKCHGTDVKFAAILSASVLHLLISEQKEFGKANPSPHTSLAANSQSIKKVMPCHAIMSCHSNETRSQQNSYYCYIKYSISEVLDSIWCELICDMYWWRTWWKLHPTFSHSPGNHLQLEPRWIGWTTYDRGPRLPGSASAWSPSMSWHSASLACWPAPVERHLSSPGGLKSGTQPGLEIIQTIEIKNLFFRYKQFDYMIPSHFLQFQTSLMFQGNIIQSHRHILKHVETSQR